MESTVPPCDPITRVSKCQIKGDHKECLGVKFHLSSIGHFTPIFYGNPVYE